MTVTLIFSDVEMSEVPVFPTNPRVVSWEEVYEYMTRNHMTENFINWLAFRRSAYCNHTADIVIVRKVPKGTTPEALFDQGYLPITTLNGVEVIGHYDNGEMSYVRRVTSPRG